MLVAAVFGDGVRGESGVDHACGGAVVGAGVHVSGAFVSVVLFAFTTITESFDAQRRFP